MLLEETRLSLSRLRVDFVEARSLSEPSSVAHVDAPHETQTVAQGWPCGGYGRGLEPGHAPHTFETQAIQSFHEGQEGSARERKLNWQIVRQRASYATKSHNLGMGGT